MNTSQLKSEKKIQRLFWSAGRRLLGLFYPKLFLSLPARWRSELLLLLPARWWRRQAQRIELDESQPDDPLRGAGETFLPPIELLVASTAKDFHHVHRSILGAVNSSRNRVAKVRVVVPRQELERARAFEWPGEVISEEVFLPAELLEAADRFSSIGRRGWVVQQLIALYGTWRSEEAGVLVMNSDTTLTANKTWLTSSGVQTLSFSHEYHRPYEVHCQRVWGDRKRHLGLSYVTHYMLMQPEILKEMFPGISHLAAWARFGDLAEPSAVAEFHTYGRWINDNYPHRVKMSRWGNIAARLDDLEEVEPIRQVQEIKNRFPGILSVSDHSYLSG